MSSEKLLNEMPVVLSAVMDHLDFRSIKFSKPSLVSISDRRMRNYCQDNFTGIFPSSDRDTPEPSASKIFHASIRVTLRIRGIEMLVRDII
ncbi:hypothetical protein L5515_009151 [Caenorhabditis briggsae]|uniref:Uncharacterized protein n=1 Tax=Caenorhabditis briggsae TaxID=6238 RepID=A0AAE9FC66_CAEBR|nr:hypothetical protein L5515_009151 [Caenorhabditis briggsae]